MTDDEEEIRFKEGLQLSIEMSDIWSIVRASINLERKLYKNEDHSKELFALRKSLEGIWGHDLPNIDLYEEKEL